MSRSILRNTIIVLSGLLVVGCASSDIQTGPPIGYRLMAGGLGVVGSDKEVSFGRSEVGAITALEKLAGTAISIEVNGNCDAKQVRFSDGLVANFRGNSFEGWQTADGQNAGLSCPV
ncbi:MAG: hypothetical protein ABJO27_12070 [Pseudoruegeria sp.]